MAGFRIGRGRDNRTSQQHPQRQQQRGPQQQPYGRQAPPPPYGGPTAPQPSPQRAQQHQWPPQAQQPYGEPEYFGEPYQGQGPGDPYQGGQAGYGGPPAGPYANSADNPGHTQAFSIGEDPYGDGNTYRAGQTAAPPAGPRLHWKELLRGIVMRPGPTFWQMRDHKMWGPALTVTFIYGLLALFGFDQAREDAVHATLSNAVPYVLTTGVAFVIGALLLGVVTHTLARQLGGDGAWQPTVGLSMLIMSITDAPRLLFAVFLGGENGFVQVLGWATWIAAGALFTSMVSKSHDLPWPKALAASSIQLIALLSLLKLGTL
ncbi:MULTISPECIES: YIP1 family protein [unclassified Streptomyces]|uniref:Yip1 family protein n=1 Tax=unclassified Streptomyces TaxID=2593676 RepID=UPI002E0DB907|nr:YIP1 family protein [Streptomyces sp. NBC_01197]WSS50593.1 YIP1 family protein [Streptomyces sp. NBC_01180]